MGAYPMAYRATLFRSMEVVAAILAVACVTNLASAQVSVRGHYRTDGTYVRPHHRSNPDGNFSNNWSTKGNVNPYTGKEGTRVTPPLGYGGSYAGREYATNLHLGEYSTAYEDAGWTENPYFTRAKSPSLKSSDAIDDKPRQVAAMNYHGIGFSTTHQQFLRAFPNATKAAQTDSVGLVSYAIDDVDGKIDVIWLQFLDDQFSCLIMGYREERMRKYGGSTALLDHAKQKFGPPLSEDGSIATWRFPTIDRSISAGNVGAMWCLFVQRISTQEKIGSQKSQSNFGF